MIYCFDLDGTLCTQEKDYNQAQPFKDRIKIVNQLYDEGHIIIIDSARGSTTNMPWRKITQQQLKIWGLKYHIFRTGKKLTADKYIDDKAINAEHFFK